MYARSHCGSGRADGQEEHITVAQQLFGTAAVQNGAAVDLAGNGKGDTAGDVGLDKAGDDAVSYTHLPRPGGQSTYPSYWPFSLRSPRAVLVTKAEWEERKLNGQYDG